MVSYKRQNKACKFFPCHKRLEDCTFCYCPFYPCLDKNLGSYIYPVREIHRRKTRFSNGVYSAKAKKNIWSCQDCSWIHNSKVVDNIFDLIRNSAVSHLASGKAFPLAKWEMPSRKTGIIILMHGSKLKQANKSILEIISQIKEVLKVSAIEPASLQFHKPDLAYSIKKLADKGCEKIIIVPVFLLNGNHVTRDVPKAIAQEKAKYLHLKIIYTKNVGQDARIARIIMDRIREACH